MSILRLALLLLLLTPQLAMARIRVADTDYRDYRVLRLDTGLTVLLVHDERAAKAAAAVALPVGSLDDPQAQPGLAHYLEHMLFLGSRSYPGPEEYQSFITRNGGQTNAATAYTATTYMLEVDPPAFAEAVRRMADTLANPLLDPGYADKERNAVNAEMESKKHSDARRLAMLGLTTLNPQHPATHFTGGNLQTLSDKPGSDLHDELVRFHRTWYSANLMQAVLYGPQSLADLEALARRELSVIPDRGARVAQPLVPPVTPAEQGVLYGVRPLREMRNLSVEFVLPKEFDTPATKPLLIAAAVIGAETDGSLIATLRAKGWALSLSAGSDTTSLRNGATLSFAVQLTEEGERHWEDVLHTIFAYIGMVRKQGIGADYFEQQRRLLDMQFRFAPLVSGFDYVAAAADQMLLYPVEDVNYADYRLDSFDQKAVQGILDLMTPQQARIFHTSPGQSTDHEAYFYQTPYSQRPITATEAAAWTAPTGTPLVMPLLNPFVPDSFALAPPEHRGRPAKVLERPGLSVWHAQSALLREPKSIFMIRLQSAHIASTVDEEAMQGVLLELWDQQQAGLRYQAQEAGLEAGVSGDEGFVLRVSGFSQHQPELVHRMLAFLDQPVEPDSLVRAKAERLRALANRTKQSLFGQAMAVMRTLVTVPSWDDRALTAATEKVTRESLTAYLTALRTDLRCTVFGFGNISAAETLAMGRLCAGYSGPQAGTPPVARRVLPRSGVRADTRLPSVLQDSALVDLYLDPETGPQAKARVLMLEGLLSTRFYSRLRTEEQLGYVATVFPVMFARGAGIGFGVQSPVQGTAGLMERFGAFYFKGLRDLRGVSAVEMESIRQGVLATLAKTPDTLAEEFDWLETDLRLGNTAFDSRNRLIRAVAATSLGDLVRAYERLVLGPGGTRLAVQVQGTRLAAQGWADVPEATPTPAPGDVHRLLGVQEYRGL